MSQRMAFRRKLSEANRQIDILYKLCDTHPHMRQTVTATQARDRFAELVNRVVYRGEEFVIQKQGKPAALITRLTYHPRGKTYTGADFLVELTKYKLRGPKDFAKKLDSYVWE